MSAEQTPEETVYERNKRLGANTEGCRRERPELGTGVIDVHEGQPLFSDDEAWS
jgi:hypothetical protein